MSKGCILNRSLSEKRLFEFFKFLLEHFGGLIKDVQMHSGHIIVKVNSCEDLVKLLYFLSNSSLTRFKMFIDLYVVDRESFISVHYVLYSRTLNIYIIIIVDVMSKSSLPSVTHLFKSVEWAEREVFEMHGVLFRNSVDLRRLLSDYGFDQYPLKKRFPTTGLLDKYYSDITKNVHTKKIVLSRRF